MRWYDITAKLYELNSNYTYQHQKHLNVRRFYIEYSLHTFSTFFELKNLVQHRQHLFRLGSEARDRKVVVKCNKIVFNCKHYSDKVYSGFIKNMRHSKNVIKQRIIKQNSSKNNSDFKEG